MEHIDMDIVRLDPIPGGEHRPAPSRVGALNS
jgi:hypothetical protein